MKWDQIDPETLAIASKLSKGEHVPPPKDWVIPIELDEISQPRSSDEAFQKLGTIKPITGDAADEPISEPKTAANLIGPRNTAHPLVNNKSGGRNVE